MATPKEKADAFSAALTRLQLTNPTLRQKIFGDWIMGGGSYTSALKADVAQVRKTDPAAATTMDTFFSDRKASDAYLEIIAPHKTPTEHLTDAGSAAGDIPGAVSDAVTPDWASGLIGAVTSANTWLRVGEVVLGLLLVVVGVAKLVGPSVLSATPVGRAAKVLR